MPSYAITGASKGIGKEYVRQLSANQSNTVVAIVRDPNILGANESYPRGPNIHLVQGNVTDPQSLLSAASETAKLTGGSLDVLIHNANAIDGATVGYTPSQVPLDVEATEKMFDPSIRTALYGGLWATNAFLPLIEKGVEKKIVHISSGMADLDVIKTSGFDYSVAYSAAKAGMNVQVAKYAVELAPKGIKVLALSPGWVDTWEDGPKPPPVLAANEDIKQRFQKLDPPINGQIAPEESVRLQLKVIDDLDLAKSGSFLSHHGVKNRW